MPRKAFLADVTSTSEQALSNILDVKRGDDDGDVNFVFVPTTGASIAIGVLALGMSSAPPVLNLHSSSASNIYLIAASAIGFLGVFPSRMVDSQRSVTNSIL